MIKNIVIGILVVLCGLLGVYSLIQQTTARHFQEMAVQNADMAAMQAEEAKKQQKLAEANAKEAHHQLLIAEQNLLECSQKKKSRN